jgi:acetylornithine/N-succinyldiaminopimelate aminotransferase
MFDEIQCGLGRTGSFLALEQYKDDSGNSIKADIVTLAKGLAGGIPAGAFLAGEKCENVLTIGDHGSTFGGNPIAASAGLVVLKTVNDPDFLAEITRKGKLLITALEENPKIKEVRGKGLMIGFDIKSSIDNTAWPVLQAGITRADLAKNQSGLLLLSGGANTIRLLPPYIINDDEIEQGLEILAELLDRE